MIENYGPNAIYNEAIQSWVNPQFYASGTSSALGGWSVVGENGPEFMYVPRGAAITPNGTDPNANVVAELQALRAEVQALRQVTAAVGIKVAGAVEDGNDATNRLGVGLQTAAYRPQAVAA